jgi:hypothetical protein
MVNDSIGIGIEIPRTGIGIARIGGKRKGSGQRRKEENKQNAYLLTIPGV